MTVVWYLQLVRGSLLVAYSFLVRVPCSVFVACRTVRVGVFFRLLLAACSASSSTSSPSTSSCDCPPSPLSSVAARSVAPSGSEVFLVAGHSTHKGDSFFGPWTRASWCVSCALSPMLGRRVWRTGPSDLPDANTLSAVGGNEFL